MSKPNPSPDRGTLVAGNWKMYKSLDEARRLAEDILVRLPQPGSARPGSKVGFFPNAVALAAVAEVSRGREDQVLVGAQNVHFEPEGAFTGEISTSMVLSCGARGVIVGHSERRHVFGETDDMIAKKVAAALESGLTAILCVGETLEEREAGKTQQVVERQLRRGLEGASQDVFPRVILAYEPVWAIGTGKTATGAQGQEVHQFLRELLAQEFLARGLAEHAETVAAQLQILYGGSVKPENAAALIAEDDIDGFLVGGASLSADSFLQICEATAG